MAVNTGLLRINTNFPEKKLPFFQKRLKIRFYIPVNALKICVIRLHNLVIRTNKLKKAGIFVTFKYPTHEKTFTSCSFYFLIYLSRNVVGCNRNRTG